MQFINSVPFYNFMKRESPLVSVVIPMYNVENYIKKCASSLFEQSLSNIEYIFVNDASSDSTVLILEKILDLYPNRKIKQRLYLTQQIEEVSYLDIQGYSHQVENIYYSVIVMTGCLRKCFCVY